MKVEVGMKEEVVRMKKKIVQNVENRIASMYNASNCQLLDDSYIMTLHTVTLFSTSLLVRTIHRS